MKAEYTRDDIDKFVELFQWSKDKLQSDCRIAINRDWFMDGKDSCLFVARFPDYERYVVNVVYESSGQEAITTKGQLFFLCGMVGNYIQKKFADKFRERVERDIHPLF